MNTHTHLIQTLVPLHHVMHVITILHVIFLCILLVLLGYYGDSTCLRLALYLELTRAYQMRMRIALVGGARAPPCKARINWRCRSCRSKVTSLLKASRYKPAIICLVCVAYVSIVYVFGVGRSWTAAVWSTIQLVSH